MKKEKQPQGKSPASALESFRFLGSSYHCQYNSEPQTRGYDLTKGINESVGIKLPQNCWWNDLLKSDLAYFRLARKSGNIHLKAANHPKAAYAPGWNHQFLEAFSHWTTFDLWQTSCQEFGTFLSWQQLRLFVPTFQHTMYYHWVHPWTISYHSVRLSG